MMNQFVLPFIIVLSAVGLLYVLLAARTRAASCAFALSLLFLTIVPSFSPPPQVRGVSLACALILATVALARGSEKAPTHGSPHHRKMPVVLVLFVIYYVITMMPGRALAAQGEAIAIGVLSLLLAAIAIRLSNQQIYVISPIIYGCVLLQAAWGTAEEFFGARGLWPRPDGTDEISHRPNNFSEFLVGRALGTTSFYILLGMIGAIGIVLAVTALFAGKQHRILLVLAAGIGGLVVIYSGTRTAALACMLGLATLTLSRRAWRKFYAMVLSFVTLAITIFLLDVPSLLGLTNLEGTRSYEHRLGILESIPALLDQPGYSILFGHSEQGAQQLRIDGIVHGVEGVTAYDNQLVLLFASTGVLGMILLLGTLVSSWRTRTTTNRAVLVLIVTFFASVDMLTWSLGFVLFVLVVAAPWSQSFPRSSSADPPELFTQPEMRTVP